MINKTVSSLREFYHNHPHVVHALLVLGSITVTIMVLEVGARIGVRLFFTQYYHAIQKQLQKARIDDSLHYYKPHPYLSYARTDTEYVEGGIKIAGHEFDYQKPQNTIRIACLGGSTTRGKYPPYLRQYLQNQPSSTSYEVMDFGCDGWTTQETMINYSIRVRDFSPDYAIIHHGANDGPPRRWEGFRPDYSHFRTHWHDQTGPVLRTLASYSFLINGILYSKGTLLYNLQNYSIRQIPHDAKVSNMPPETARPFQRNLQILTTLLQDAGTKTILATMPNNHKKTNPSQRKAIKEHNQIMRNHASKNHIPLVETQHLLDPHPDWFVSSVHLNQLGRTLKGQVFGRAVLDLERGYSNVAGPSGNNRQVIRHFDERWKPERMIELQWEPAGPEVTDYHVYVLRHNERENEYVGRTKSADITSFVWKKGGEHVRPGFQKVPQIGESYHFTVFAITEESNRKLKPKDQGGSLTIRDRMVFHIQ